MRCKWPQQRGQSQDGTPWKRSAWSKLKTFQELVLNVVFEQAEMQARKLLVAAPRRKANW